MKKVYTIFFVFVCLLFASVSLYAQYSILRQFTNYKSYQPMGDVITDGTYLFGMTNRGGDNNDGVIFRCNPDGTVFEVLHHFGEFTDDGRSPWGSVILYGDYLFGMTNLGGTGTMGSGIIFKIKTDGTDYTILHNFDGTDGDSPQGNLIKVGSYLYGMTYYGGINDDGTIFKIDENGTYYSVIYNFDQTQSTSGAEPNGTLIYNSPYLYGVTEKGGSNNKGVIFYVNTDGTGFNNLYSFGGSDDAIFPCGALVHYGDILFGMTKNSQTSGYYGTIYQISTTGTGYSMMHTFTGGSDGASPYGSLTLYGTDLYGMTNYGGANSDGTIFKIAADGSSPDYGYQLKHSFSGGNDGGNNPYGSLLVYSGFLYGMTLRGGYYSSAEGDLGIIFKMSPGSSGISIIHRFSEDGNQSYSDFVSDGTKLFGMTYGGGFNGVGTVFSMNPDGSDYNVLHEFAGGNDGTNPKEGLLLYNNVLYGTTQQGGTGNNGTIFKINKDGSGYSILYSFAASGDGQNPIGSLIVVNDGLNDILYGMTQGGDPGIYGTIFQYNIGTSLYNNIYNFVNDTKGGIPYGNLIFYNDYLYGTTSDATGNTTSGTIFKAKKDGTTLDVLHYFGYIADDGLSPTCGMILDNGTLYGTTM